MLEHTDCVLKLSNVKRLDIWTVIRTILEKNPGIRARELIEKMREKTGLSRSTVYAHLYTFHNQGKVHRVKGRYWLSTTENKGKGKRSTLRHSRQLILGLEAILAEDWPLYRSSEPSEERAQWEEKIEREGIGLKEFAIEHLRSGYPSTYEKMKQWRNLKEKAKQLLLREGFSADKAEAVLNFASFFDGGGIPINVGGSTEVSEECQKLLYQRVEAYEILSSDIRFIILRIEAGKPLRGTCRLCHE